MDRLGIPRRPQAQRLALGRQALATRRAETAQAREAHARQLGFQSLAGYLRARHHGQRWPRRLIAGELGVTVAVVTKLMQRADVPALRGVSASKARRPPP